MTANLAADWEPIMALSDIEAAGTPAATGPQVAMPLSDLARSLEQPQNRYRPDTPWSTPWALGMTVLNILLFIAISSIPLIGAGILGWVKIDGTLGKRLDDPLISALTMWGTIASQLVSTGFVLWISGWWQGSFGRVLSFSAPLGGRISYFWAIPAFVIYGMACGLLIQSLAPKANDADTKFILMLVHSPNWWVALLAVAVGAPIVEELMFRGFLFSSLARSRIGIVGAAIVSSLMWAMLHIQYSVWSMTAIFALGLMLSFILWRTGSTRVTMMCHSAYNAVGFLLALAVSP
jgi:uncharacterized protein